MVSSFQGVGIEEFHTEVFSFQGVGIEELHCPVSGCWNRGVTWYTEVSSFFFGGGGGFRTGRFHSIQRCSHFRVFE